MNSNPRATLAWLRRNWKWVLPVFIGGTMLFATCIVVLVFSLLRSSVPVNLALAEIRRSDRAVEALGEPIEIGLLVSGSIRSASNSGQARLTVPVYGPKGQATAAVDAVKGPSGWQLIRLILVTEDEQVRLVE